mmetsp:Transcript_18005/g.15722  ORF Transcript_18005/g.15722 Transcript_18005/m.15722 type:complete len:92 (+) Transcript_18005:382-657(+)
MNPRAKVHIKKKFKKAVSWAQNLKDICKNHTEEKSVLESEAYLDYMQGMYHFEIEEWDKALNSFKKAHAIYDQLCKYSNSVQKILYKEKIE